jgi:DNA helicase-2/ATP-dependent DNA helicase PcrA
MQGNSWSGGGGTGWSQRTPAPARTGGWPQRPGVGFPQRSAPRAAEPEPTFERGDPDSPFQPGTRVRHATFGGGTVLEIDGYGSEARLTVKFDTLGVKKLIARFVRLG